MSSCGVEFFGCPYCKCSNTWFYSYGECIGGASTSGMYYLSQYDNNSVISAFWYNSNCQGTPDSQTKAAKGDCITLVTTSSHLMYYCKTENKSTEINKPTSTISSTSTKTIQSKSQSFTRKPKTFLLVLVFNFLFILLFK